jgi:hypothetical protein
VTEEKVSAGPFGKITISVHSVTAPGKTGQLRHHGKRFALQFGLELAFADRLVIVRC